MDASNARKKILVVDDDAIFLCMIEEMLKDDYDVFIVKSGKEALELLVKGIIPNLILLDILMPLMDGWETFHKLRGITMLVDTPIAFVSSEEGAEQVKRAHDMGAVDYLMKPVDKESLLSKVQSILKQ